VRSLLRRTTQVDRLTPLVHTPVFGTYAHLHAPTRPSRVRGARSTPTHLPCGAQPSNASMHARMHARTHARTRRATSRTIRSSEESHGNEPRCARSFMNEPNDPDDRLFRAGDPSIKTHRHRRARAGIAQIMRPPVSCLDFVTRSSVAFCELQRGTIVLFHPPDSF